ncbi:rod-determining factor RdfA [Natronomonas sp. EA1]|uniref:rod-determining factor RdfA n=1 Tax=Natronomonas sp. EA1 TaxID=3421655 RepID=UPI003EBB4BF0
MTATDDTDGGGTVNSKVARVIDEYDLEGKGAWLERHWLGDGVEQLSLRDLADAFNRSVLEAALRDAGEDPLDAEIESTYEVLTDGGASPGDRVDVRNQLEWKGVDVETLEADFVSHQAIHTYLRKVRGAEQPVDDGDRREKELQTVERLAGRTRAVTEDAVRRLVNRGELTLEEFEVLVDVRVLCGECGTQYQLAELFDQGGCDCTESLQT